MKKDAREPVVTDLQGVYRGFLLVGRHFLRVIPASVPTEYALGGAGPVELEVMTDRTAGFDFPLTRRVGSVEGFVFDDRTGSGLPGVKVALSEHVYTYTGEDGAYRIRLLPAGEYHVRVDLGTLPFGFRTVGPSAYAIRVEGPGEVVRRVFRAARPVSVTEF